LPSLDSLDSAPASRRPNFPRIFVIAEDASPPDDADAIVAGGVPMPMMPAVGIEPIDSDGNEGAAETAADELAPTHVLGPRSVQSRPR
jgi:hypothetical protein